MASLALHVLLAITLVADRYVLSLQHNRATRVLLFPSLWTGLWFLFYRFGPIGDYPALSTALVNWPDFAQVASLGGRPALDFLIALFGTCIVELSSFPVRALCHVNAELLDTDDDNEANDDEGVALGKRQYFSLLTHPIIIFSIVMTLVLSYGGARTNIHKNSFYQVDYPEYIPKNKQVGCVVGPGSDFPELQMNHDIWFNKSTILAEVCIFKIYKTRVNC